MSSRFKDLSLHLSLTVAKLCDWKPFIAKTERPEAAQRAVLRSILERHAGTGFGVRHRFASLRTYEEFVREVPVCTYEDLRPGIEAQEQTQAPILTASQPILFTQTSGTTGAPKHIPILSDTVDAMRRYQRLFAYAQWQGVPTIYQGGVLVISGQTIEGHLPGGTPFGSMSGLLFDCLPAAIRGKSLFPEGPPAGGDYRQRYFAIAARALADPSLSVLATPNPSTILKLLDVIRSDYPALLEALAGRARPGFLLQSAQCSVRAERLSWLRTLIGQATRLDFATLWPDL